MEGGGGVWRGGIKGWGIVWTTERMDEEEHGGISSHRRYIQRTLRTKLETRRRVQPTRARHLPLHLLLDVHIHILIDAHAL